MTLTEKYWKEHREAKRANGKPDRWPGGKRRYIQVWMEGYVDGDQKESARFLGSYNIDGIFRTAVVQALIDNDMSRKYLDWDNLTWWGCRLFNNESDARRLAG